MMLAGLLVQREWYEPMDLFMGRRVGGELTLGDTSFTLIGTWAATNGLALALHFLSPCCRASMRARIPGSECVHCETRYVNESSVLRLDCPDKHDAGDLEAWLSLNGWNPLQASLIADSLSDLYEELEPDLVSLIGGKA